MTHSQLAKAVWSALGVAACSALLSAQADAADFRVYGSLVTGLYYTDFQDGTNQSGVAGKGQVPSDSTVHLEGREKLGDDYYVGFNIGPKFTMDDGALFEDGRLFNASRLFIGNKDVEFSFGSLAGLTVTGEPYSSYARLNANLATCQLDGIAPAGITYQPGDLTNAIAFSTPMGKKGFFLSGLYTNGDAKTEDAYLWSDVRHVAQLSSGWVGDQLRVGFVYSYEMPGDMPNADGSMNKRHNATHALHLMASWDDHGTGIAGILFASKNAWRVGAVDDLGAILGQGDAAAGAAVKNDSSKGLDTQAVVITAHHMFGPHEIAGSLGYMHGSWEGVDNVGRDNDGSLLQGGVVYRYYFSKMTHWYAAASIVDGRKLFDTIARYNKTFYTSGIMMNF